MTQATEHPNWSNRWTFILAATGSAVGLGNIWKFPYITGEYGGGAFVLVYLACIALIGIPVMMAEITMGRRGQENPVDASLDLAKEAGQPPFWGIVGYAGVLAGLMILMFYSVVAGWVLEYVLQSASGNYMVANAEQIEANFGALTADFNRQLLWHSLFLIVTLTVVGLGVTKGIGKAVEILMPLLFVMLGILLVYSFINGDPAQAIAFMFQPDFSKLSGEAVLVAMGHAFFTLSLGMGAIMVYGSYMPRGASIAKTGLIVAGLDTLVALVAGLAVFPIVFANGLEPSAGPGLMFVTLPNAFAAMPGGAIFGTLFFALVAIAALSSAISLIEPGVAWLERRGIKRVVAVLGLGMLCWIGGIASIHNGDVFNFLDNFTAKYMLPLGGLLIAVFVGWVMSRNHVQAETQMNDSDMAKWFFTLRYIAPVGVLLVFLHSLGLFGG